MAEQLQINEMKTDVRLLLDCLKCQLNNPSAGRQALLTLASIFNRCDYIKEYFKDIGGLNFLLDILISMENAEFQEADFFCLGCAIERNVFSQKTLTKSVVFEFLHKMLSSESSSARLKQTAIFFLINLVSNNGEGQVLVKRSHCLADLMNLVRKSLPRSLKKEYIDESWFEDAGETSMELWTSVISALCVSMNNPQNEENQQIVGMSLPFIFSQYEQHHNFSVVTRPLLSLIGFTAANNLTNQGQIRRSGGIIALSAALKQWFEQPCSTERRREMVHIITALDSCTADNVDNAKEIGELGVVQILLHFLNEESLEVSEKIKVTITLGHVIELSEHNRQILLQTQEGLQHLVQHLTVSSDEEFTKAIKYVLQISVQKESFTEEDEWKRSYESKKAFGENILEKINEISDRLKMIEQESKESNAEFLDSFSGLNQPLENTDLRRDNFTKGPGCNKEDSINRGLINTTNQKLEHPDMNKNCITSNSNKQFSFSCLKEGSPCQENVTAREDNVLSSFRYSEEQQMQQLSPMETYNKACVKQGYPRNGAKNDSVLERIEAAEENAQNTKNKTAQFLLKSELNCISGETCVDLLNNRNMVNLGEKSEIPMHKDFTDSNNIGNSLLTDKLFKVPKCFPPKRLHIYHVKSDYENSEVSSVHNDMFLESDRETGYDSSSDLSDFDKKLIDDAYNGKDVNVIEFTPVKNVIPQWANMRFRNTKDIEKVKEMNSTPQKTRTANLLNGKRTQFTPINLPKCFSENIVLTPVIQHRESVIPLTPMSNGSCYKSRGGAAYSDYDLSSIVSNNREKENVPENPIMLKSVYDFSSGSDNQYDDRSSIDTMSEKSVRGKSQRRLRIPYSSEEISNLLEGVKKLGKFWRQILVTYKFHPARTSVDLMEKYKRLSNTNKSLKRSGSLRCKPFSPDEKKKLVRGVQQYGQRWSTILQSYKFSSCRTAEDLRNKWRSMCRD